MNSELLLKAVKDKEITRKKIREKSGDVKEFSWVLFFAGEEFNQELAQNQTQKKINLIDFSEIGEKNSEWIEGRIKEICNGESKQLADDGKYPIIWFKNIEKINNGSVLEQSLLPIFDPQQNTDLFNDKTDLSKYILIATSSTRDMGKLSAPLTSRLDCINVSSAEPKKFFLDKYFTGILIGSIFLFFVLLLVIFWPNKENNHQEEK